MKNCGKIVLGGQSFPRTMNEVIVVSATGLMILWAVLVVAFVVLEGVTIQLVSIWFAAGALAAFIASACKVSFLWQTIIFIAVSLVCLAATRPLVKRFMKNKPQQALNADRCIGAEAIVTEEINNLMSTGAVKVGGAVWTARSADGSVIPAGETVIIEKIEGVKVFVHTGASVSN